MSLSAVVAVEPVTMTWQLVPLIGRNPSSQIHHVGFFVVEEEEGVEMAVWMEGCFSR